jgi:CelD/BcsL family acetyltransferase involved in cellulose biosynthesis
MSGAYRIDWLRPRHARRIAQIARRGDRLGRLEIEAALRAGERSGTSLCVGAFAGAKLVGYLLAFVAQDSIQVAHVAVARRHAAAMGPLSLRLRNLVRERSELRGRPVRAYCREHWLELWRKHRRFLARMGYELGTARPLARPFYELDFRPRPVQSRSPPSLRAALRSPIVRGRRTIGVLDSTSGWNLLAPWWNRLVAYTKDATVFQAYEYMRTWWRHFGLNGRPWIVVVLREDVPIAVAPLQIATTRFLGRELRCLTFLGQASEIDRPTLLGANDGATLVREIADYIFDRAAAWDCLVLPEQRPGNVFLATLAAGLRERGYLVTAAEGPLCARVAIEGTWQEYLAGRSRGHRKSLRRKTAALAERDRVHFEIEEGDAGPGSLERYLAVERASWKPAAGLGVGKSSAHLAFYRALLGSRADFEPRFRFLRAGDRTIAASFGLLWRRRFYSLHIAHDARWDEYSPGVLLTAHELEHAFESKECEVYDFLGGFLTNKRSWATAMDATVTLYADAPTVRGRLFHWLYFDAKPRAKRLLTRVGLLDAVLRLKKVLARRMRGLDAWT